MEIIERPSNNVRIPATRSFPNKELLSADSRGLRATKQRPM